MTSRRPPVRETDIRTAVKNYLELRGFRILVRTVGGAWRLSLGGRDRYIRFSEPGAADLYGWDIRTGKHIEVEVKTPHGKTHPLRQQQQQAWLDMASRTGAIAFRVSSVEECEAELEKYGYRTVLLV